MKVETGLRGSGKTGSHRNTTADATPTLHAAIMALEAGSALDELVGRSVLAVPTPGKARGLSSTWEGTRQLVSRLTSLGCQVQMDIQSDGCICKVLRSLEGTPGAKPLAVVEAGQVPEAVAKAAVIACLQMQPHSG